MIFADAIRDLLESIPSLPVPYPDAWRYAFIMLGCLIIGVSLAISVEAEILSRGRRDYDRRKIMAWHIRLVSFGTNLIVLLLVCALYLRTGMENEPLSPLIYPAMLGEVCLAAGLVLMLLHIRRRVNGGG